MLTPGRSYRIRWTDPRIGISGISYDCPRATLLETDVDGLLVFRLDVNTAESVGSTMLPGVIHIDADLVTAEPVAGR
jgi:hypothetical protein